MARIKFRKKNKNKNESVASPDRSSSLNLKKEQLKRKRKALRIKRRAIIIFVFVSSIGGILFLFKAPIFNIKQIICVGQEKLTEKQIVEIAEVEVGKNIFLTNIGNIKERVSKIPYVSESNARRIFPNKVKIWVREEVPVFAIKKDNQYMICDVKTKVLEKVTENKNNECTLTLTEYKSKNPGEIYLDEKNYQEKKLLELIEYLEKNDMINYINNIDFSDISDIIILYDNRLKIKIGNTNEMDYKIKFINKVIKEKISPLEKATMDFTGTSLYVGQFEEKQEELPENIKEEPIEENKEIENGQETI